MALPTKKPPPRPSYIGTSNLKAPCKITPSVKEKGNGFTDQKAAAEAVLSTYIGTSNLKALLKNPSNYGFVDFLESLNKDGHTSLEFGFRKIECWPRHQCRRRMGKIDKGLSTKPNMGHKATHPPTHGVVESRRPVAR